MQVDVLLATPLRLARALKRKSICLADARFLILDEADKLFEEGLLPQIDSIVHGCSNPDKVGLLPTLIPGACSCQLCANRPCILPATAWCMNQ